MFDMVGNIFKNLGKKPATRKYPFEKRAAFAHSRGRVQGVDIDVCIFCGLCARKCPADAIAVNRVNKSWELDPFKCVICGACAEACPKKCIVMDEQHGQAAGVKVKMKYEQQAQPKDNQSQVG